MYCTFNKTEIHTKGQSQKEKKFNRQCQFWLGKDQIQLFIPSFLIYWNRMWGVSESSCEWAGFGSELVANIIIDCRLSTIKPLSHSARASTQREIN